MVAQTGLHGQLLQTKRRKIMSVNIVSKTTGETTKIAGENLMANMPIGSIIPYGGSSIPSSYLLCDGRAVSRTTYSELFAVIGTAFGTGDGSTTFNVPDLREATTKGVGLSGKSNNHIDSNGLTLGEFIDDQFQNHTHSNSYFVGGGSGEQTGYPTLTPAAGASGTTQTGAVRSEYRSGATTEVKSVGVNYIIKALSVGVPADYMSAVDDAVDVAMSEIGTIVRADDIVHPTTTGEFDICTATVPAGTWIINCFSELNYDGTESTYNNILKVTGVGVRTARTTCKNGGGSTVSICIAPNASTVVTASGYATSEMLASSERKQHSSIEAIRIK